MELSNLSHLYFKKVEYFIFGFLKFIVKLGEGACCSFKCDDIVSSGSTKLIMQEV